MENAFSVSLLLYLLIPAAFLLGSIPFGIIFTKGSGVDIRSVGSRNIGATNVLRSAGKVPAILTLLGDILKGSLAVILCRIVLMKVVQPGAETGIPVGTEDLWLGIISLTAVLGHMLSVFLKFRGGKGVATGFGVMMVYSPPVAGLMLLVWIAAAVSFKYSALSALISVSLMPFLLFLFGASSIKIVFGVLLALIIIYKHKTNIRALLDGTEEKIGDKK
jgi:glycerol-3-phosphate acyltransferase PlsY